MSKEGDRLFFIAVKPMFAHLHKQRDYGLTQSCNLQTKLENTSEYSVLCESERVHRAAREHSKHPVKA